MSQERRQSSRLVFRPAAKATPKIEPRQSEEERLKSAREKANEYRNPRPSIEEDDSVTKMDEWANLVTTRIEEAIRRGDFENLRGHGKPMSVDKDPFIPEDRQMAYQILKNNDMTPMWIEERKEMLAAVASWRENFQRVTTEAHNAWVAAATDARRMQLRESWARWLTRWEAEIVDLNRRIGNFNLKQPVTHLEIFKLRLDDELRKVGMVRALGD
jgi:hypothetical protein